MTWLILILSYAIGVIPSGKIVSLCHGVQIEKVGSGNVGATNVARALGKKAGLLTLVLDVIKGITAVLIAKALSPDLIGHVVAAAAVVFGHCIALPGILRGGKGIATSLGILIALVPLCAVIALSGFILVFLLTRIVSLSSLAATFIVFVYALSALSSPARYILALIPVIVTYRHFENIKRLIQGDEPRFEAKS
jgi:glycerol-3-phosphate acyltransferase PlsY